MLPANSHGPVIAIDKASVHKICSGQVIISLSVAVKELVENSLDAGSTVIDISLKDYGACAIEVADNGSGVREDDLEALALKHHTSKLANFSHLESVVTFGFRGEALSSLCALSDVTVVTRHASCAAATKLQLDRAGKINERSPCARPVGTTVTLKDIFHPLPVRHKEFRRNLKSEFNKMLQMLYAYCVVCKNVRMTCSNRTSSGKRVVVATRGNDCVMKNLRDVFGSKGAEKLIKFEQFEPNETILAEFGLKNVPEMSDVRFEGFVSSCEAGAGRNQCDRQFYYVNGRPCDAPKFVKVVNEAYHVYNKERYPLVALDLLYDRKSVDVNVTPDKRKVFLNGEKMLLAILKASLTNLFAKNCGVFVVRASPKRVDVPRKRQVTVRFDEMDADKKRNKMDLSFDDVGCPKSKSMSDAGCPKLTSDVSCPKSTSDADCPRVRRSVTVAFSIARLRRRPETTSDVGGSRRLFTAKIAPDDNSTAESELRKQLDKRSFGAMRVVGQFNLGFVVAKLASDLFIVDQHASDEKFNYETLEKRTELKAQPLIRPQQLFLTAVEENVVVDNASVFAKNGFKFDIDADESRVGSRVKLTAVPCSENVVFDKSDVEELIYLLRDSPGVLFRPTRVRRMLASRACRKSVMIGTALSRSEMRRLLAHMSQLEQPWNCPHGRPTIRHLLSLNRLD